MKQEATPRARVCEHLRTEAHGAAALLLFLDCDREGENICFEVMENALPAMRGGAAVLRARFSAVTPAALQDAMRRLGPPNAAEAAAVDARQELDLKACAAAMIPIRCVR